MSPTNGIQNAHLQRKKKTDKHKNTASALNESPKVDVSLLLQLH